MSTPRTKGALCAHTPEPVLLLIFIIRKWDVFLHLLDSPREGSLSILPSPCPLSLSRCLCLSVSVSHCPLLFLLLFSLVIAWTQLFHLLLLYHIFS